MGRLNLPPPPYDPAEEDGDHALAICRERDRQIAKALREWAQDYETQMKRCAEVLGEPGHFDKSRFALQLADEIDPDTKEADDG